MMKRFVSVFALASVLATTAAFAAQVIDLGKPETLSQYGAVEQAPGANNGLVFMAHQDCVVTQLPGVVKKIDHEGGSALSATDLPLEILRGREVTIWYSQDVTPKGFVEKKTSPTPTPNPDPTPTSDDVTTPAEPVSDDVSGPEVTSLEGLKKAGDVRERKDSVWVDFAPTSNGTFGGELVAFKVTGLNSQERVETFQPGYGYIVAEASVLENVDRVYTNTIASLRQLNLPGFDCSSEKYIDGNIRVTLQITASKFFYGENVFKISGAEQLLTDPNGGRYVYMADGSDVGVLSVFMKAELADPTDDGEGGSGSGGGGCDSGFGTLALALVGLALRKRR